MLFYDKQLCPRPENEQHVTPTVWQHTSVFTPGWQLNNLAPPSLITLSTTGQHWRGLSRVFYEEVWLLDWLFLWPDVSPINFKTNQASLQNWSFCSQSVTSQSVASFMILLLTPRNVSKPTLKRLNEILTSVQRIRWTASTTGAKSADPPPTQKKENTYHHFVSSACLITRRHWTVILYRRSVYSERTGPSAYRVTTVILVGLKVARPVCTLLVWEGYSSWFAGVLTR